MKIMSINSVNYGSTGNIMLQINRQAGQCGMETKAAYMKCRTNLKKKADNDLLIGTILENNLHLQLGRLTGYNGCFSQLGTWLFLRKVSKFKPDLIHLHNLHNCYINLPMLFSYIKRNHIPVVWTLHDCWAFTGQCPHFTMAACSRWKTGCGNCSQYKMYPAARVDRTKRMWELKRNWFTGVENLTIVTPSQWLADLVKESFLKEYPVKVINNGIDLSVFKPTKSNFREMYHLENKKVILGVAFGWGEKKGLDAFIDLCDRLPEDYRGVLVGTDDNIDRVIPEKILSIHRTSNPQELAEIYTAADVFFNPTREENYPTVNMEALACGTPVVTFRTGGSAEIIDEHCGISVPCDDLDAAERAVRSICEKNTISRDACLSRAGSFDASVHFKEYVELYSAFENMA